MHAEQHRTTEQPVLSVCVVFAAVWRAFAGNVNDFFRVMYMMLV